MKKLLLILCLLSISCATMHKGQFVIDISHCGQKPQYPGNPCSLKDWPADARYFRQHMTCAGKVMLEQAEYVSALKRYVLCVERTIATK